MHSLVCSGWNKTSGRVSVHHLRKLLWGVFLYLTQESMARSWCCSQGDTPGRVWGTLCGNKIEPKSVMCIFSPTTKKNTFEYKNSWKSRNNLKRSRNNKSEIMNLQSSRNNLKSERGDQAERTGRRWIQLVHLFLDKGTVGLAHGLFLITSHSYSKLCL